MKNDNGSVVGCLYALIGGLLKGYQSGESYLCNDDYELMFSITSHKSKKGSLRTVVDRVAGTSSYLVSHYTAPPVLVLPHTLLC